MYSYKVIYIDRDSPFQIRYEIRVANLDVRKYRGIQNENISRLTSSGN